MGTSTLFRRYNDLKTDLSTLSKKQLKDIDNLSPWGDKEKSVLGWDVLMELHNSCFYPLVFWGGRLLKLEDAPKALAKKGYDKYKGKETNKYEWTFLKKFLIYEIERLDKEFKKHIREVNRQKLKKK